MTAGTYLLDTNVCIDFLLGRSLALADRLADMFGSLAVSAVTAAELRVGSRVSSDPEGDTRRIDAFLAMLDVVPFDDRAARAYADIVHRLGVRRNSFDRLIGAQAVAGDFILVTRNEKDFADIPRLRFENWTI